MAVNSARPRPMILAASLAFILSFGSACGGGGEEAQCASRVDFTTTQYDGIDPHIAVSVETDEDTVYIKHGLNSDHHPKELKRLVGKN